MKYKYRVGKIVKCEKAPSVYGENIQQLTLKENGLFKLKKYSILWECKDNRIFGIGEKVKFWTQEDKILDIRSF